MSHSMQVGSIYHGKTWPAIRFSAEPVLWEVRRIGTGELLDRDDDSDFTAISLRAKNEMRIYLALSSPPHLITIFSPHHQCVRLAGCVLKALMVITIIFSLDNGTQADTQITTHSLSNP